MVKKVRDFLAAASQVCIALSFVGWCAYVVLRDVKNEIVHWNDRVYVVGREYDPVWGGNPPRSATCFSPAQCEPSGKPSWQYFAYLKEYEVREWGLDPAHMIPEPR